MISYKYAFIFLIIIFLLAMVVLGVLIALKLDLLPTSVNLSPKVSVGTDIPNLQIKINNKKALGKFFQEKKLSDPIYTYNSNQQVKIESLIINFTKEPQNHNKTISPSGATLAATGSKLIDKQTLELDLYLSPELSANFTELRINRWFQNAFVSAVYDLTNTTGASPETRGNEAAMKAKQIYDESGFLFAIKRKQ